MSWPERLGPLLACCGLTVVLGCAAAAPAVAAADVAPGADPPAARLARGIAAFGADRCAEARDELAPLTTRGDVVGRRARLYEGVCAHRQGEEATALAALAPLVGSLTDADEHLLLLETLSSSASKTGRLRDAIVWGDALVKAKRDAGREVAEDERQLAEVVARGDEPELFTTLIGTLAGEGAAFPLVVARLAELQALGGDFAAALEILDAAKRAGRWDHPRVRAVADAVARRETIDAEAIGFVVPRSGRARLVGEEVVRGAMLAARAALTRTGRQIKVVLRDEGGSPERAAGAVEELVLSDHVIALVGPLSAPLQAAVLAKGRELDLPVLTLAVGEPLPREQAAFRLVAPPAAEARALVRAARAHNATRFAILGVASGFGRTLAEAFAAEVQASGGNVAVRREYPAGTTDFPALAKELAKVPFDALLFADGAQALAQAAPSLAAAGLWSALPSMTLPAGARPVLLLVPSVGLGQEIVRRANRYLQGAIFCAPFDPHLSTNGVELARAYREAYQAEPSIWAAAGYDAVWLLTAATGETRLPRRQDVAAFLRATGRTAELPAVPLAMTFSGFDPAGEPLALPGTLRLVGAGFETGP